MGLAEYIKNGVKLNRTTTVLQTDATGSGSVNLGSVYALLSISTTVPCRLRLYEKESSRDLTTEINRTFGDTNVSPNISLVGDFSMSVAGTYTIDPVMYGVVQNPSTKLTYYRIDNVNTSPYPALTFNSYLMENSDVDISSRKNIPTITSILNQGSRVTGYINDVGIPRTYLLVSASLSGSSTNIARIRLYSTSASLANTQEVIRPFTSESTANSKLIVDAILSGSETTHFVPKIVGANLNTMETDLNSIKNNTEKIMGVNELYYILENVFSSGTPTTMSVSFHVFSLED